MVEFHVFLGLEKDSAKALFTTITTALEAARKKFLKIFYLLLLCHGNVENTLAVNPRKP